MPPTYQRKSGWNIAFQDSCTHSSLTFTHKYSPFPHSKTHYSFTFTYNHTLLPHIHTQPHTTPSHSHYNTHTPFSPQTPLFQIHTWQWSEHIYTSNMYCKFVTIPKYIYQLTSPPLCFPVFLFTLPFLIPPPLFSSYSRIFGLYESSQKKTLNICIL